MSFTITYTKKYYVCTVNAMNSYFKGHSPPPEVKVHLKVSSDIGGEGDGEGRPEPPAAGLPLL